MEMNHVSHLYTGQRFPISSFIICASTNDQWCVSADGKLRGNDQDHPVADHFNYSHCDICSLHFCDTEQVTSLPQGGTVIKYSAEWIYALQTSYGPEWLMQSCDNLVSPAPLIVSLMGLCGKIPHVFPGQIPVPFFSSDWRVSTKSHCKHSEHGHTLKMLIFCKRLDCLEEKKAPAELMKARASCCDGWRSPPGHADSLTNTNWELTRRWPAASCCFVLLPAACCYRPQTCAGGGPSASPLTGLPDSLLETLDRSTGSERN